MFRLPILTFAIFLGLASMLRADQTSCLANPSRACVLQMVVKISETRGHLHSEMYFMFGVAIAQERNGNAQSAQTFAQMMARLDERGTDPEDILKALVLVVGLLDHQLPDAPELSRESAGTLVDLEPTLANHHDSALRMAAICLGYADAREDIDRLLKAVDERLKPKITRGVARGLMARGDFEQADEVLALASQEDAERGYEKWKYQFLQGAGEFEQANLVWQGMSNANDKAKIRLSKARQLAGEGRFPEALEMIADLEKQVLLEKPPFPEVTLLQVLAYAGEEERLLNLRPAFTEEGSRLDGSDFSKWRAITALVLGEPELFYTELRKAENELVLQRILTSGLSAYTTSGQTDLDPFFEHLPPEYLSHGLNILGRVQAEQGDLERARETFARVTYSCPDAIISRHDGRGALAQALAQKGRMAEAIALSYERDDALSLLEFAEMTE